MQYLTYLLCSYSFLLMVGIIGLGLGVEFNIFILFTSLTIL